jgi:tetratricopeptide (TPR) repeat protein
MTHTANFRTYMVQFDEAWEATQDAMKLAEAIGDKMHTSELLGYASMYHHLMEGNLDAAEEVSQKAMEIADHIGYAMAQWQGYYSLGLIASLRGEYEKAVRLLETSHQHGQKTYPFVDLMSLGTLCSTYVEISDKLVDNTREYEALAVGGLAHPPFAGWAGATAWVDLGLYEMSQGHIDKAGEYFDKGLTTPSTEWLLHRPRYLVGAALVALSRGQVDEASRLVLEAKEYAQQHKMGYLFPLVALTHGKVNMARNDIDGAVSAFATAESLAEGMKMRPLTWQARAGLAEALATCGRLREAGVKRQEAEATVNEIAALFENEEWRALFLESAMGKLAVK